MASKCTGMKFVANYIKNAIVPSVKVSKVTADNDGLHPMIKT
jgi:hypothetical protein